MQVTFVEANSKADEEAKSDTGRRNTIISTNVGLFQQYFSFYEVLHFQSFSSEMFLWECFNGI